MPHVIDSLVLEFGIDPKNMSDTARAALEELRKFEEQAGRSGKNIESSGLRIEEMFASVKRSAIGLLAVFLGGREIKEFIGYVTNADAATGRLAKTMNMSTQELSEWQGAMTQAGGSAESITGALQGATQDMNRFMLTGQGTLASVLRPLGISLFDNNNRLKTAGQLFLELSDAVSKMDPARAAAFLSMIPGMNQDSVNLLIQGRKAVEGYLTAARQAGGATADSAAQAAEYQKQLALLDRSATSLGRNLFMILAPGLTAVTNALSKLLDAWRTVPGSPEDKQAEDRIRGNMNNALGSPEDFLKGLNRLFGSILPKSLYDQEFNEKDIEHFYRGTGPYAVPQSERSAAAAPGAGGGIGAAGVPLIDRYREAIAAVESRGEGGYSAIGPVTSSGDRAYGRYQVMGNNIPSWTKEVLGRAMSPDEFLRDHAAQDAVFNAKFGQSVRKYGNPQDAASVWFTGKPLAQGAGRRDVLGTTGAGYVSKFNRELGAGAVAAGRVSGGGDTTTTTSTTHVGTVVVQTQATDAQGIARDIKPALENGDFAANANDGQQ